jgi:transcriptional regulator with XRE-family HTH domain
MEPMEVQSSTLPGVAEAKEYLGLSLKQIAQAVQADESTLHRWLSGPVTPSPVFLARLEAVEVLVKEMRRTFREEARARQWLSQSLPALDGKTPIELVLEGRSEVLTGMLYALNSGMSL